MTVGLGAEPPVARFGVGGGTVLGRGVGEVGEGLGPLCVFGQPLLVGGRVPSQKADADPLQKSPRRLVVVLHEGSNPVVGVGRVRGRVQGSCNVPGPVRILS